MAKKKSYSDRLNEITTEIERKLSEKAAKSTLPSNHIQRTMCLRVKKANFNLDGNRRWLTEVTPNGLLDCYGLAYSFSVLTASQLGELADELL